MADPHNSHAGKRSLGPRVELAVHTDDSNLETCASLNNQHRAFNDNWGSNEPEPGRTVAPAAPPPAASGFTQKYRILHANPLQSTRITHGRVRHKDMTSTCDNDGKELSEQEVMRRGHAQLRAAARLGVRERFWGLPHEARGLVSK